MALVSNLISYLQELEDGGQTHVYLDGGAREVLNELQRNKGRPRPEVRQASSADAPASSEGADFAEVRREFSEKETAPATAIGNVAKSRPLEVPQEIELPAGDCRTKLNALASICKMWPPSGHLPTLRKKLIFAGGNPESAIMIVGDSPAFQEERAKKPFVGPAGQKLEQILKAMGLGFDQVYLTNLVKFRPILPKQTTNDRKPAEEEIAAFLPILKAELEIVEPKVVIALGEVVSKTLLGEEAGKLDESRGKDHKWQGVPLRVTFHPSYLLHSNSALGERRKLWEDMLGVMELLDMPISDKQRGFFKK